MNKKTEHILRMLLGFCLYWLVAMLMPASWWVTPRGWFWRAVPHFGYYAYQEKHEQKTEKTTKT